MLSGILKYVSNGFSLVAPYQSVEIWFQWVLSRMSVYKRLKIFHLELLMFAATNAAAT